MLLRISNCTNVTTWALHDSNRFRSSFKNSRISSAEISQSSPMAQLDGIFSDSKTHSSSLGTRDLGNPLRQWRRPAIREGRFAEASGCGRGMFKELKPCRMFNSRRRRNHGDHLRFLHEIPGEAKKDFGSRQSNVGCGSMWQTGSWFHRFAGMTNERPNVMVPNENPRPRLCKAENLNGGRPSPKMICRSASGQAVRSKLDGSCYAPVPGNAKTASSASPCQTGSGTSLNHRPWRRINGKFKLTDHGKISRIYADWLVEMS